MPYQLSVEGNVVHWTNVDSYTYCNGSGPWETRTPMSQYRQTSWRERSWVNTPNFRSLKKSGARLPDNPFSHVTRRTNAPLIRFRSHTSRAGNGWDVCITDSDVSYVAPPWGHPIEQGSQLSSGFAAKSRALSAARGAELQLPVVFAEGRQVVQMVSNTIQQLAGGYRDLRRGRFGDFLDRFGLDGLSRRELQRWNRRHQRNPSGAAANAWLQFQYGWKPLLYDVKSAMETFVEHMSHAERHRAVAYGSSRDTVTTSGRVVYEVSPGATCTKICQIDESWRVRWKFSSIANLSLPASLGLLNPALVVWELVPLSFVVDWFLPIGDYLTTLDTDLRFNHAGGTVGYRRVVNTVWSDFIRGSVAGEGTRRDHFVMTTRTPLASSPVPGFDSVMFNPQLNTDRLWSALALGRQRFLS